MNQYTIDGTGCWVWLGKRSGRGYGAISRNGTNYAAHRVFYEQHKGLIPNGMVMDHKCRNILCVNPDHLEVVTAKENTLRGIGPTALNARKSYCKRGHSLAGDNLRINRSGWRICRACQCLFSRNHRKRKTLLTELGVEK